MRVEEYIKDLLDKGISPGRIKKELIKSGYSGVLSESLVNKEIEGYPVKGQAPPFNVKVLAYSIISVIILSLGLLLILNNTSACGRDCFIEKANFCSEAVYYNHIGDTQFKFTVNPDCSVNKEVIALGPDEPDEIVELFSKKSMVCNYEQSSFDPGIIDSITYGIDSCSGELKDLLVETILIISEAQGYDNYVIEEY